MLRLTIFTAFLMLGPSLAPAEDAYDLDRIQALARAAPADVTKFVTRKLECDHWAGEEPYDRARAREIARAVRRLRCDDLDRDESRLRKAYAANPDAAKALDAARGL